MIPAAGEPEAAPWSVRPLADVVDDLLARARRPVGRPAVVAVDGRSAGGKSTLTGRIADAVPGSVVVHTDDVAWWESFFGWDALLAAGVLEPARAGLPVAFRPPAWDARGRSGAIEVPVGASLLLVEGVGASRRALTPLLDAAVWVQSDATRARDRGIARDLAERPDPAEAARFWDEWESAESPFLASERPWERADVVVCGTPALPHDPLLEVVVGRRLT
ncbi:hypothetical protein [Actinotalea sp.]|uniref:uridine kinase family protein n=1 Tax=Actinotalea sp. TaxID=1872145 RepID=UPI002D1FA383|nr:hypothetical protein [Actinotalea sp.]